jgi:hypothetical protein
VTVIVPSTLPVGPVYAGRFCGLTIAATLAVGTGATLMGAASAFAVGAGGAASVVASGFEQPSQPARHEASTNADERTPTRNAPAQPPGVTNVFSVAWTATSSGSDGTMPRAMTRIADTTSAVAT